MSELCFNVAVAKSLADADLLIIKDVQSLSLEFVDEDLDVFPDNWQFHFHTLHGSMRIPSYEAQYIIISNIKEANL